AGQAEQARGESHELGHHLVLAALLAFVECVGGVAPHAAERAAGEAQEDAGLTRPSPLALDREEDLVDGQHLAPPRPDRPAKALTRAPPQWGATRPRRARQRCR